MTRLDAMLSTLLPAEAPWPSGASVAAVVTADLPADDLAALLAALPSEFAVGDEAALRQVERDHAALFDRLVTACYLAYYTDPAVRAVLEQLTGYEARPPQPLGYALPPFDDALLDPQRRRAPFWRDPEVA